MYVEPTLFDWDEQPHKLANTRGTLASHEAAAKVAPQLKGIKKDIVDLLATTPKGLTIFEMAAVLRLKLQTVSGRPGELLKKENPQIFVHGTRELPGHQKATVYKHVKYRGE